MAPFKVGLINLKPSNEATKKLCEHFYAQNLAHNIKILYGVGEERPGVKFADMDLIGLPYQVVIGPKGSIDNRVEVKNRQTEERFDCALKEAFERISKK